MPTTPAQAQVITRALTEAEKLFQADLMSTARRGSVRRVREAACSLALILSFQSPLGANDCSLLVANLIGQFNFLPLCFVGLTLFRVQI